MEKLEPHILLVVECKMVWLLWKAVWQFLRVVTHRVTL